jgi:hypothetical protein
VIAAAIVALGAVIAAWRWTVARLPAPGVIRVVTARIERADGSAVVRRTTTAPDGSVATITTERAADGTRTITRRHKAPDGARRATTRTYRKDGTVTIAKTARTAAGERSAATSSFRRSASATAAPPAAAPQPPQDSPSELHPLLPSPSRPATPQGPLERKPPA